MPARSKAQQRFFGYLKAHPEEARKRGISVRAVEEFATTGGNKNLPEKLSCMMGHKKKKK